MKLFLLILTFILLIAQSYGKQVSFEQAKQVAEQFLIQGTNPQLKSSSIFELNDAGSLFNEPSGNTQLKSAHISNRDIYAFNIGNNRGFILISGNNAAVPVLGYSKYGNISPENIPSNMLFWLKEYKNQICYLAEQNTKPSSEAIELWKGLISTEKLLTTTVDPLLTSKWDQSPYENLYSPYDEDYDEVVPTGCGATAMAQIMNYWEFPYAGIGTHTYEDTNYGEQFADFNSMVYDWDNMPDQLDAPNEAVSVLMYHCGVAVDMQYDVSGNGGSGCYTIDDGSGDACVETAFPTYFGYDEGIDGILRNEYSDKDWEDVIIQELEAGRPVQYSGSDIDYGGGHTWACDGYDASSYFHMNWGWGGYCDGFYLLDALVPGTGGIGSGNGDYSYEQDAIIGIQPGILPDLLVENVEWLVDGGDALEYKFDVSNIGEGDVNQDIKCFVLLANDDEEYLLDEFVLTDFLENGTTFSSGTLSVNLSAVLEGNYYLYVVVDAYEEIIETDKENNLDKDEWPVIVEPMLLPDLIVENVNWWSAEDGELTYSFDLSNIGAGDINRDITCYVELYSAEDESDDYELAGEYLIVTNSLAAGETVSTDILTADISSIPSGSYYLAIYVDDLDFLAESNEDNNNGEDSVPLTIENLPDLTVDEVYWYEGYTTEEIQFDFKVTNNGAKDINEDIECVTYLSDGLEEYAIHYYTIEGGLGAGESIETSILTGDLNGIPNGEYSFIVWVNYDSWIEESNEENNIGEDPVTLSLENALPDLIVEEVYWFIDFTADEIDYNFRIANDSPTDITEDIYCFVYVFDGDESYAVGSYTLEGGLGAGETFTSDRLTGDLIGIPNGDYSFRVNVDYDETITEANEENNIGEDPVPLTLESALPDLIIEGITGTADDSKWITYSIDIRNVGGADIDDPFSCEVALVNENQDGNIFDTILYSDGLGAGVSNHLFLQMFNASSLEDGEYYLVAFIDSEDEIEEDDEENNVFFDTTPITIKTKMPDLSVTNVNWTNFENNEITFDFDFQNIGDIIVTDDFEVAVYLEDMEGNLLFIESELYEEDVDVEEIVLVDNVIVSLGNFAAGNYYLIVTIDDTDVVTESDEDNNDYYDFNPITVSYPTLDIAISNVDVISLEGNELSYSFEVSNESNVELSENFYVSIYLHNEEDQEYLIDAFIYDEGIEANQVIVYSEDIILSDPIPEADYQLYIVVDSKEEIGESDEDNNYDFDIDPISIKSVDLEVSNVTCQSYNNSGINFSFDIKNPGNFDITDDFYINFYLNYEQDDEIMIESYHYDEIVEANDNVRYSSQVDLNSDIAKGDYYFYVVVDSKDEIEESSENNNVDYDQNVISLKTAINEYVESKIQVYPNPTKGVVNVLGDHINSIEIVNNKGQVISRFEINTTIPQINMSNFLSGIYYLKVNTLNEQLVKKIIKE